MSEQLEQKLVGVVCLRCGKHTPVGGSSNGKLSSGGDNMLHFPLVIIRCPGCGKEGSYLAAEIVAFDTMPKSYCSAA
jgi:hypothetical protein